MFFKMPVMREIETVLKEDRSVFLNRFLITSLFFKMQEFFNILRDCCVTRSIEYFLCFRSI